MIRDAASGSGVLVLECLGAGVSGCSFLSSSISSKLCYSAFGFYFEF